MRAPRGTLCTYPRWLISPVLRGRDRSCQESPAPELPALWKVSPNHPPPEVCSFRSRWSPPLQAGGAGGRGWRGQAGWAPRHFLCAVWPPKGTSTGPWPGLAAAGFCTGRGGNRLLTLPHCCAIPQSPEFLQPWLLVLTASPSRPSVWFRHAVCKVSAASPTETGLLAATLGAGTNSTGRIQASELAWLMPGQEQVGVES